MLVLLIVGAVVINSCSGISVFATEIKEENQQSIELIEEKEGTSFKEEVEEKKEKKVEEEKVDENKLKLNTYDSDEVKTKLEGNYRSFKTQNYNIMSQSLVTVEDAKTWARKRNATCLLDTSPSPRDS